MYNHLMVYCRKTMRYSPMKVARLMDVDLSTYQELEHGEVLMTFEQARRLAKIYDSKPNYFYEAAQQLDLLLTGRILIHILNADNERLKADLKDLKDKLRSESQGSKPEP